MSAKVFFSYFPQFTPDPLNDVAWGNGFTDWDLISGMSNADRQRFLPKRGHYDPSRPEYLATLGAQLDQLGFRAGLMVYHYCFDGRHVLPGFEKQVLEQRWDRPFFFCWANESWSKRWVGLPNEVIVEQRHVPDLKIIDKHVEYLSRYFEMPAYYRWEGRPVFLVYNAQASPALPRSLAMYREQFARRGLDPLIGCCVSFPQSTVYAKDFDVVCEFQPRFFFNSRRAIGLAKLGARVKYRAPRLFEWMGSYRDKYRQHVGQQEFRYSDYLSDLMSGRLEHALRSCAMGKPLMRSTFLTWDNTPRYGKRKTVVSHASVDARRVMSAIATLKSDNGLPAVVNSWNEWSEGAALEAGEVDHPLRDPFLKALDASAEDLREAIAT